MKLLLTILLIISIAACCPSSKRTITTHAVVLKNESHNPDGNYMRYWVHFRINELQHISVENQSLYIRFDEKDTAEITYELYQNEDGSTCRIHLLDAVHPQPPLQ